MKKVIALILLIIFVSINAYATETNIYRLGDRVSIGKYGNNLATAKAAIGYTNNRELDINTNVTIFSDCNIQDNILVRVTKGGLITQNDPNFTLIIHNFESGNWRCFGDPNHDWVTFGQGACKEYLPQWWGAKGDNTTICTKYFKRCIAALPSEGSKIKIIDGTYIIDDTCDLRNNLIIEGNGIGSILKLGSTHQSDPGDYAIFHTYNTNNVIIKNLMLDGNQTNFTGNARAIYCDSNSINIQIDNLTIKHFVDHSAILLHDSNNIDIQNCIIKQNKLGIYGLALVGLNLGALYNCRIIGNTIYENVEDGILLINTYNSIIKNNIIYDNELDGIHIFSCDYNIVSSNIVHSNAQGVGGVANIYIDDSSYNIISNNRVHKGTGTYYLPNIGIVIVPVGPESAYNIISNNSVFEGGVQTEIDDCSTTSIITNNSYGYEHINLQPGPLGIRNYLDKTKYIELKHNGTDAILKSTSGKIIIQSDANNDLIDINQNGKLK